MPCDAIPPKCGRAGSSRPAPAGARQEPRGGERSDDRRGVGKRAEELAAQHLGTRGYRIVERNWRCPTGELDLVVRDGDWLVFVEVRGRRGTALGSPEESITRAKQARLIGLAEAYVQARDWTGDWRIDVVAVEWDERGRLLRVDHYENAVTA